MKAGVYEYFNGMIWRKRNDSARRPKS